jgi:hypothetical protein
MDDDTNINNDTALALFVLLIAGVAMFILAMVIPAPGEEVCLSKREARHLWPRQHIYWYSADHCWSNRRGGPPRHLKIEKEPEHKKEKKIKTDPIFSPKAEPLPAFRAIAPLRSDAPMVIVEDGCCWPILSEFDLRWAGVQP